MIFNIVGILIGALIAGGAGFYLVKGEKDAPKAIEKTNKTNGKQQ